MMSSCMFLLREENSNHPFPMIAYLNKHHNAELVFDPSDPAVDTSEFD